MYDRSGAAREQPAPESIETFDVPAAVLCAACGSATCDGRCLEPEEPGSGVVAIVPWERPGTTWARLWGTARASTQGASSFFAALPTGEVRPALRFALLSETLAVCSLALLWLGATALAFPTLALDVGLDPRLRAAAARTAALAVVVLIGWMLALHLGHGLALDRAARRAGGKAQRRRAVRFGLYACGWDLMTSPLGASVTLATEGVRATLQLLVLAVRVPAEATTAMLRGIYALDAIAVARARRGTAFVSTFVAVASCLLVALAAAAWLLGA